MPAKKCFATKEEIEEVYIGQNRSVEETAKHFGMSKSGFSKVLQKYGIKKPKELKIACEQRILEEKYGEGVTASFYIPGVRDKVKKTIKERYGVEHQMQNPEIAKKVGERFRERYGENYDTPEAEERNRKIRETCRRKYGTDNPMQNKEVHHKAEITNIARYGASNPGASEEIKKKIRKIQEEKYGGWFAETEEFREKTKRTCQERYGADTFFGSSAGKQAVKDALLEKYGADSVEWAFKDEFARMFLDKDALVSFLSSREKMTVQEISDLFGIGTTTINRYIKKYDIGHLVERRETNPERELKEFLDSLGVVYEKTKAILDGRKEIDFYCKEYNFGIEFDGSYWHREERMGKDYHQKKTLLAEEQGVFLYHIFGYEWRDSETREKIKDQLCNIFGKNDTKIFARKCVVKEISSKEKAKFFNENHLQCNGRSSVSLGLFYEDELVAAMSFCKPRFNHGYNWEIGRFCCKRRYSVIGGAGKLFSYFLSHYEGSVISYSDMAKGTGRLYEELGFTLLRISPPNYRWVNAKEEVLTRYQTQMKDEAEIMQERGYWRVFDCGNKVWVFNR